MVARRYAPGVDDFVWVHTNANIRESPYHNWDDGEPSAASDSDCVKIRRNCFWYDGKSTKELKLTARKRTDIAFSAGGVIRFQQVIVFRERFLPS